MKSVFAFVTNLAWGVDEVPCIHVFESVLVVRRSKMKTSQTAIKYSHGNIQNTFTADSFES